jgi:general secretion pathway protein G
MHSSGFTLIELIVVMAIIGILVATVAGNFQTSRLKGNDARRKSDLKQIQNALETYFNDVGLYPTASAGQIVGCTGGAAACVWGTGQWRNANNTVYMSVVPGDVSAPGNQYLYVVSATRRSYKLFARLQNTQDPGWVTYTGNQCGNSAAQVCSYGVSSTNTTPTTVTASMP